MVFSFFRFSQNKLSFLEEIYCLAIKMNFHRFGGKWKDGQTVHLKYLAGIVVQVVLLTQTRRVCCFLMRSGHNQLASVHAAIVNDVSLLKVSSVLSDDKHVLSIVLPSSIRSPILCTCWQGQQIEVVLRYFDRATSEHYYVQMNVDCI